MVQLQSTTCSVLQAIINAPKMNTKIGVPDCRNLAFYSSNLLSDLLSYEKQDSNGWYQRWITMLIQLALHKEIKFMI